MKWLQTSTTLVSRDGARIAQEMRSRPSGWLAPYHLWVRVRVHSQRLKMKGLAGTWGGFLQRVPAVEGPLLLLAQIGAMLQQPMGDPTLADAWKAAGRRITKRFAQRLGTIYSIYWLSFNSAKLAHFQHFGWTDKKSQLWLFLFRKQSSQSEAVIQSKSGVGNYLA